MTDESGISRRGFMQAAAGGTAVAAGTGTAAAAESTGTEGGGGGGGGTTVPAWPSYLSDANGFDEASVADQRGSDSVTVEVGTGSSGFGFSPPTLWISPGTTVQFEWTGQGGSHNVVSNDGPAELDSGSPVGESGVNYEYTFEEAGINTYYCNPHESSGMKGGIAVGDDVETTTIETGGGGGGEQNPEHMGIPLQAHFVGLAAILMMMVSLVFTFYLLKYGESAHAKGGN